MTRITRYKQSLYQDWKDGEITQQEYRDMKADYERQAAELADVLTRLNAERAELKQLMDGSKLSFTPAVEVSCIRPKHQIYRRVHRRAAVVSLQGPGQEAAGDGRENQLNPDVIDAVLSQEKKKENFEVIISSAELAQFFGKDKTPCEMKDQIMALLGEWKEKQLPELGKGEKKKEMEKCADLWTR